MRCLPLVNFYVLRARAALRAQTGAHAAVYNAPHVSCSLYETATVDAGIGLSSVAKRVKCFFTVMSHTF